MIRGKNLGVLTVLVGMLGLLLVRVVIAHGNVTTQLVNTEGLEPLGEEWLEVNPYRGNETAIEIGKLAYGQNCARCHGIEAKSGGIAPDLRLLGPDRESDRWFIYRFRDGATRNGVTYMPPYRDILGQEAGWAIRSWLDTQFVDE